MKEFKSGTISVRFLNEERRLLELAAISTNHSCSDFLKMLFSEWLIYNEEILKETIEHRKRLSKMLSKAV